MSRKVVWSTQDDLLLKDTVIKLVKEGSTLLSAFEEVGQKLNRTAAACSWRWNAIVKYQYEEEFKQACLEKAKSKNKIVKSEASEEQSTLEENQQARKAVVKKVSLDSIINDIKLLIDQNKDTDLEKENEELKSQVEILKEENKQLKEQNQQLIEKVNELNEVFNKLKGII